jgi:hypothetical protein
MYMPKMEGIDMVEE